MRGVGWPEAPLLLEEIYNFEDALIVGGALLVMINNADRVKAVCLAQLVNVIGPIFTETSRAAWRQTFFHPFAQAARYAVGDVLRTNVTTGTFAGGAHDAAPLLVSSVVHDPDTGNVSIFALNRSTDGAMDLSVELRGLGARSLGEIFELHHADLKAINSKDHQDEVSPVAHPRVSIDGERLSATLKPLSWNVFVTKLADKLVAND